MFSAFENVLLIRLRSIGDTVLMTPVLETLKRWKPELRISVILEPLSAPLLEAHPLVDDLIVLSRTKNGLADAVARAKLVAGLRKERFDAAFNLHGGTTGAWLARLAGAKRRIAYPLKNTKALLTDAAPPPTELWGKSKIHCVEQQLGLLKFIGIPVSSPAPRTRLYVSATARTRMDEKLKTAGVTGNYAVLHPGAAFASKQWEPKRFAAVADALARRGIQPVISVAPNETAIGTEVRENAESTIKPILFNDLPLSETMSLIAGATVFVGNDSGPAHIAAGFQRPTVVIFGSSNDTVWHPWTDASNAVVRRVLPCVPCAGPGCHAFPEPECIRQVQIDEVLAAVERVLAQSH
jgi:predicted lipopolysaccharide heptosyltransferase III